MSWYSGYSPLN